MFDCAIINICFIFNRKKNKSAKPGPKETAGKSLFQNNLDSQIFTKFVIIKHAYNPVLFYIFDSNKASCPIIYVIILGRIA